MNNFQQWALTICCAGVGTGIIRAICVQEKKNSVIKAVLTLYILVLVFAPIKNLRLPELDWEVNTVQPVAVNAQALALQTAQSEVENTLYTALAAQEITAEVTVTLQAQADGNVDVQQVVVRTGHIYTEEQIKEVISKELSADTLITVEREDGNE